MRANHIAIKAIVVILVIAALFFALRTAPDSDNLIYLIVQHDAGHYWRSLIQGATLAAQDNGWRLEIAVLQLDGDMNELLTRGEESGATYIALSVEDQNLPSGYRGKTPLVLLGCDCTNQWVHARVYGENSTIGKRTGQLASKHIGLQKQLLLIATTATYDANNAWETSLTSEMGQQGSSFYARINCKDDAALAYGHCMAVLERNPQVGGIICQSENATVGALRAVTELGLKVPIIGADYNSEIALGLTEGRVAVSVVPNAYAYGYMGIENAIHLNQGKAAPKKKQLNAMYVEKENMYDEEMLELLYEVE